MQFINIVVHSVENMNFRVHLQYEFTQHGLDKYLEVSFRQSLITVQISLDPKPPLDYHVTRVCVCLC